MCVCVRVSVRALTISAAGLPPTLSVHSPLPLWCFGEGFISPPPTLSVKEEKHQCSTAAAPSAPTYCRQSAPNTRWT